MIGRSSLQVLADTRCADQVIRLTRDATSMTSSGNIEITTAVRHEWMHYFQFSATPTGVMLSQYRRDCFASLKIALTQSVGDNFDFDIFEEDLDHFKSMWQAWPPNWYEVERTGPHDISKVILRADGLHVNLVGSRLWHRLPIGHHSVYEAHAWCASAAFNDETDPAIPKGADHLLYTWPAWVLADLTHRRIEEITAADISTALPILLSSICYDYRILPGPGPIMSVEFQAIREELAGRGVTIGRLVHQLFSDYQRFWENIPLCNETNSYLTRIGLPTISTMLEQTADMTKLMIEDREHFVESAPDEAGPGHIPYINDVLAEIDLLRTSLSNLELVAIGPVTNLALHSPLHLIAGLVPPVCALEDSQGYRWFSFSTSKESPWKDQGERIVLRQQLSITEHVLMKLAFGSDLACHTGVEWKLPINACPAAADCMALISKRGIEFCVDPAWRSVIGLLIPGIFNHKNVDPSEQEFPGIREAILEAQRILKGNDPNHTQSPIDYGRLGLPNPWSGNFTIPTRTDSRSSQDPQPPRLVPRATTGRPDGNEPV